MQRVFLPQPRARNPWQGGGPAFGAVLHLRPRVNPIAKLRSSLWKEEALQGVAGFLFLWFVGALSLAGGERGRLGSFGLVKRVESYPLLSRMSW
jgi:hypothetical protein